MNPIVLPTPNGAAVACEEVEVHGHIIDSLILPKILDCILNNGGTFRIKRIAIGQSRHDPSHALVEVRAERPAGAGADPGPDRRPRGRAGRPRQDCRLEAADIEGAFPEGFYSTTNQRTEVRLAGQWIAGRRTRKWIAGCWWTARPAPPAACP